MKNEHIHYDAVALLSGGLDSILAARHMQDLGHTVLCLHFTSPFFDKSGQLPHWEQLYGLTIQAVSLDEEFAAMLVNRPAHGFGKTLNPCVDCKICMLKKAREIMEQVGARYIISGEVLGQRPMSQRRDSLHIIQREAGVAGLLLRPLSALHLDPTAVELCGFVDRSSLLGINGRGRKKQLALAHTLGFSEVPTPAGGCRLAEQENARSYWAVLQLGSNPGARDFHRANTGRQFWNCGPQGNFWLCVGRNKADNERLLSMAETADRIIKLADFPGPIALARHFSAPWPSETLHDAAAFVASFSPKACCHVADHGGDIAMELHTGPGDLQQPDDTVRVMPCKNSAWQEYPWEKAKEEIRAERKAQGL